MKYYEAHDQEYKKRLMGAQVAWDKGAYEQFDMLPLIQRFLKESRFASPRPRALDLGCGTGALAVFLAGKGFDLTALDISPTAIEMAEKQAGLRNVKVDFFVGDVCQVDFPEDSFDLVTDNHFLHCIVFDEERKNVLRKIQNMLKPEGEYWIETMVGHPDMKPRPDWNLDAEGISWVFVDDEKSVEGCVKRNGKIRLPIRRIRNSSRILEEEIQGAGMDIVWMETAPPIDEYDTGTFRARCCKRKSSSDIFNCRGVVTPVA